jgi:hypothetical protein
MKRVFVGGIIMGRAPKDIKHPRVARERYGTAGWNIGQDKLLEKPVESSRYDKKKRTTTGFFASMRHIANPHQQATRVFDLIHP